ncbi:putative PLC-like phosphodiesterase [Lyophyllum shimeji]|uniref:PLC-like phosphodiesterase n=1 Tax=Lyophyllum shimeji TaxID=47721 RepID=A0A9P3UL52_LYOSH|nr:putative PLC-like phosphodiesterase [Lyophyllum shimeji]
MKWKAGRGVETCYWARRHRSHMAHGHNDPDGMELEPNHHQLEPRCVASLSGSRIKGLGELEPLLAVLSTVFLSSSALGSWIPRFNAKRATVCNGHAELCGRSYGNVTYLGAHNSFAASSNPFALARTQEVDVTAQLNGEVRMLQGQAHMKNGQLHFCHTTCGLFDGGTVEDYLRKVKAWLDGNPNEVLTFIFTNPEGVSIPDVWKPAFDNSGITPLAYVPPSRPVKRGDWPTLGQLIDSGKRVVVFLDAGADGSDGGVVNFILPEFQMIWEDPFSPTDPNFPCRIDRTSGPLSNDDHENLINHNLNTNIIPIGDGVLISDRADAPKTNSIDSILKHANGCAPFAAGRAPNFVLLDYVNVGQGPAAVDRLNGF